MAQQIIERTQSCYILGDSDNFSDDFIGRITPASTIAVYLDATGSENADGIPRVGVAREGLDDSESLIYGKLDVLSTNWDALGEPTVDANGNITYPTMATIITAGVVTFTGILVNAATGAREGPYITGPPIVTAVGKQIRGLSGGTGSPPAPIGSITALLPAATQTGTGRVIARSGTGCLLYTSPSPRD